MLVLGAMIVSFGLKDFRGPARVSVILVGLLCVAIGFALQEGRR